MSLRTILKQADIFAELTTTHLELVASISAMHTFNRNDVIVEENTPGGELYVIANGKVDIQIDPGLIGGNPDAGPQTIATLERGQSFGEVALVDQGIRSASVRCAEQDTEIVVIPRDGLMRFCNHDPEFGYRLMRGLAADLAMKIRRTDLMMREQLTWARNSQSEP